MFPASEDRLDSRGCRVQHVLTVVHHEQEPPPRQRLGDGVDQRGVALRMMPSTVAMAAGTVDGSPTGASSTIHTPSGNSPASSAPPRARAWSCRHPDATERDEPIGLQELGDLGDQTSRPTKELSCWGRFPRSDPRFEARGTPTRVRPR